MQLSKDHEDIYRVISMFGNEGCPNERIRDIMTGGRRFQNIKLVRGITIPTAPDGSTYHISQSDYNLLISELMYWGLIEHVPLEHEYEVAFGIRYRVVDPVDLVRKKIERRANASTKEDY